MVSFRLSGTALVLGIALLGAGSHAQTQIPPAESGDRIVNVRQINGMVEMRDAETNAPIILPRSMPLSRVRVGGDSVTPVTEVRPQPAGFDVVYRFHNTSTWARRMGALQVGVATLGEKITFQDFRWEGKPLQADARRNEVVTPFTYPSYLYSPAVVIRNNKYAVGMSLLYPAMDYKQDIRIGAFSPGGAQATGEGGRGWAFEVRLQNFGGEQHRDSVRREAWLQPGEQRTYVIAIRVTKTPAEWIRTLLPYRAYFQALYGGVRYPRDARPVHGVTIAGEWLINSQNPSGWAGGPAMRPDREGFGPWAQLLMSRASQWPRSMLWAPTGLYKNNRPLNYPFQFTSRWMAPGSSTARLRDAVPKLRAVADAGVTLGLWWGRATSVMTTWDTSRADPLNPDNPQHVAAAFAELDLAVQAGATMVGLDAYFVTPAYWDCYRWMQMMQARHPQVKFITEGRNPDFMHTLCPTWMEFYDDPAHRESTRQRLVETPFFLADFILPGHETWGGLAFNRMREMNNGVAMTPAQIAAEVQRAASLGYVPVVFDERPVGPGVQAAATWTQTVPPDIQSPVGGPGTGPGGLANGSAPPQSPPPAAASGRPGSPSASPNNMTFRRMGAPRTKEEQRAQEEGDN